MTPSDEKRLGRAIINAQERLRLFLCRTGTAAQWHLAKATKVVEKPKLLGRVVPHLEGAEAARYLEELPGWIEQTTQQDAKCAELWQKGGPVFDTQQKHLIAMFLRYNFSLRSYERCARQPSELLAVTGRRKKGAKPSHDEAGTRMSADEFVDFEQQIANELEKIDQARAELVAGHAALVEKLAQASDEPLPEATRYAQHGLLKAAEYFDVRRGQRFATYAQKWIKAAIKDKITEDE